MVFDCRGYEPIDFGFGGFWKAEAVSFADTLQQSSGQRTRSFVPILLFDAYLHLSWVEFFFVWPKQESGTKFDEIDLSSGEEFTEYDEKGECPVMISNFRASFTVTK